MDARTDVVKVMGRSQARRKEFTMNETPRSIVAGFDTRNSAEQAADELLDKGFTEDDVIVAVRDHDYASSGGAMVRSEEEDAITHLAHLIGLTGIPEAQARMLAIALDSKDAIVAIDAGSRLEEAETILGEHGGIFEGSDVVDRPEWEEARHVFRGHWESRSDDTGRSWDEARPAYHYVYEKAVEPEFRGRTWRSAEPDLQSGYEGWMSKQGYPAQGSTWDWFKETLHELWTPTTRGAPPDDIVHPERLHRWVRLTRSGPATQE
jgi:hypothetical protein